MIEAFLDFPITMLFDEPVKEGVGKNETENCLDYTSINWTGVEFMMNAPNITHKFIIDC